MNKFKFLVVLLTTVGCASINRYYNFDQESNNTYTKYKGQKVVRMEKVEDLKNAFGRKDIYGGKVDKGGLVVYYAGLQGNKARFLITEQDIKTNASVFTRYFKDTSTVDIYHYGYRSSGTITHNQAPKEHRIALPADTYEILVDSKGGKLEHEYFEIEIMSADDNSIRYLFKQKVYSKKLN